MIRYPTQLQKRRVQRNKKSIKEFADLDFAELFERLVTPPAAGLQLILHVLQLPLQLLLPG